MLCQEITVTFYSNMNTLVPMHLCVQIAVHFMPMLLYHSHKPGPLAQFLAVVLTAV